VEYRRVINGHVGARVVRKEALDVQPPHRAGPVDVLSSGRFSGDRLNQELMPPYWGLISPACDRTPHVSDHKNAGAAKAPGLPGVNLAEGRFRGRQTPRELDAGRRRGPRSPVSEQDHEMRERPREATTEEQLR
jgi:hypothetical protein